MALQIFISYIYWFLEILELQLVQLTTDKN